MKRRSLRSLTKKETLSVTNSIIKVAQTEESESRTSTEPNALQKFERFYSQSKRFRSPELFNEVKESVHNTFTQITPRVYRQVKELTSNIVDEKQEIERLCKKYSMIKRFKKSCFENVKVNADVVANDFILKKENELKKKNEKARLRREMLSQSRFCAVKEYKKTEEFFSFNGDHLKDWEKEFKKHHKKSFSEDIKKTHPYLKLYQEMAKETLERIDQLETNQFCKGLPEFPEPEEWEEKAHHNIQWANNEGQLQKRKIYHSLRSNEQRANPKLFFK